MSARIGWFDGDALYGALDAERRARNLTWKQVAAESGVSASTLTPHGAGEASRSRQLGCALGLVWPAGR